MGATGSAVYVKLLSKVSNCVENHAATKSYLGWGLFEQVENFLVGNPGAREIKNIVVGELNHFRDARSRLSSRLRLP
jgi:hypothetical protein